MRLLALLALVACCGCAAERPQPFANLEEVRHYCREVMYTARGQGRAAPNWNLYDACVRRHAS